MNKKVEVEQYIENLYHLFYEDYPKECAKAEEEITALLKEILNFFISNKKMIEIARKIKVLDKKYPNVGIGDTDTDEEIADVLRKKLMMKKTIDEIIENFYDALHR